MRDLIMKSEEKGRLSTMGPVALEQIAGLNIDLFFMGAGGGRYHAGVDQLQPCGSGDQTRGHQSK